MNRIILAFTVLMMLQANAGRSNAGHLDAGTQKHTVTENKRIEGAISITEPNRIRINGDRIDEVIGLSEDYALESDGKTGQIFVKAAVDAPKDAVFSIVTEKGKTQDFKLKPKSIEGQIILLENKDELLKDGKVIGVKNARHDEIIALIKIGMNSKKDLNQKAYKKGDLELNPITQRKSGKYTLEVWELKNISKSPIALSEKQFADKGIAAIMLDALELQTNEVTRLYKVRHD